MAIRYLKRLSNPFFRGYTTLKSLGLDRVFFLTVRYLSWKLQFQNQVSAFSPRANFIVTGFVLSCMRLTIRLFRLFLPEKYTSSDPYAVLYVDPDEITHVSTYEGMKRRGWVIDGDWDRDVESFDDRPIPKAIRQHFEEDVDWRETELADRYDDSDRFRRKCERIERLHDRIVADGYRTQRDLLKKDPTAAWEGVNATISPLTNEITVDIGRDGEILFNMLGKHRLSIAKVTGVETVPVMVFCRHRKWHQAMKEGSKGPQRTDLDYHPDG